MRRPRSDWLPPVVVFIVLATLAWVSWRRDLEKADMQARQISQVLAGSVAHQLSEAIDQRRAALEPLRTDALLDIMMADEFRHRAGDLQNRYRDITVIARLDLDGTVVWSRPLKDSSRFAPGADLTRFPGHEEAVRNLKAQKAGTLTGAFLLEQDPSVGMLLPIEHNREIKGILYASLEIADIIDNAIPQPFNSSHYVSVREDRGGKLYASGPVGPGLGAGAATALGRRLRVDASPRPAAASAFAPRADIGRLFVYIFTALVIAGTVWVALHERQLAEKEADERKLTADSLKLSEARLSEIIARSPWPILEHDKEGHIQSSNQSAEQLLGLSSSETRGKSILDWTHPEDRDRIRPLLMDPAVAAGHTYESRVQDAAGGIHFMRWSRAHRYNGNGKITGGILFGQDVTAAVEANRAQEKLIAEEERVIERLWVLNDFARSLRTSLDAQSLYQISINAASNVLANRSCAILTYDSVSEMFEVRAARAATGAAPPLPQGARFPASSTQLRDAVAESRQLITENLSSVSFPHETEIARHGYHSRAAVPILVDNLCVGLLVAYSTEPNGITRDSVEFLQGIAEHLALALTSSRLFSQLTEAYNETRTAQARIVEMEKLRAVGEMTSGIAHDFNNMLMAIIGNAEMLDEPDLGEERLDYVQKILTAAGDAAVTVNRLQEYSRKLPESDNFESLEINKIAGDAVDLTKHKWKNQAQSRGVVIDVKKDLATEPLMIRGSAPEIREVLTNLIFNAVDAMPEGGTITLGTGRRGQRALLYVRDTGTGMTEDVRRKIFTPFFSTKGRQGNGLGLAMSYGIIRKHGGEVEVESAPGQGTTFTLVFPAADVERRREERPVELSRIPTLRVLVVDDDPDVSVAVAALVQKLAHEVEIADSGYEAVKRLRASRYDVILTDLGMPGMSGREVALAAKDISPNTPVILLTGWGEQVRAEGEVPPGVDLVLSKPVRRDQLDDALRRTLRPEREKIPM